MKQQTAMQQMLDELMAHEYTIPLDLIVKCKELISVEKEQIVEAWKNGNLPTNLGRVITEEQYYNEKYKGVDNNKSR
jgi:hypothetical protein